MLRSDASVLFRVDEFVVARRHRIWTQSHFAFADKRTGIVVSGLWSSARVNGHRRAGCAPQPRCSLRQDHRMIGNRGVSIPMDIGRVPEVAMAWESHLPDRGRILQERKLQADTALACRAHAMVARRLQHQDDVQS